MVKSILDFINVFDQSTEKHMNPVSLIHLFNKHRLEDVFTPTSIAKLTYIKRKAIEEDFKRFIRLPGLQIVMYGNSGSGKTTLVMNMLNSLKINRIKTSCTEGTTFDQLIIESFDRLGVFYTDEKSSHTREILDKRIAAKYFEIEAEINKSSIEEQGKKEKRIIPIQLTPQRLAEFLGQSKCVWVIEDFHKVKEDEKKRLAQVLKVFMDTSNEYPEVKIICIGAVATARELIHYDRELANRVAEIYVPLMSADELKNIAITGFKIMNVMYKDKEVLEKIVHYSNSLASVCHHLCYDICSNNGINRSNIFIKTVSIDDINNAVRSYLKKVSDSFLEIYEKACRITHCKKLLLEITERNEESFNPKTDNDDKELVDKIVLEREKILNILCTSEYGEIFRMIPSSQFYTFSSPLFQTFIKMKFTLEKEDREAKRKGIKTGLFDLLDDDNRLYEYIQLMDQYLDISTSVITPAKMNNTPGIIKYEKQNNIKKDLRNENKRVKDIKSRSYRK